MNMMIVFFFFPEVHLLGGFYKASFLLLLSSAQQREARVLCESPSLWITFWFISRQCLLYLNIFGV